MHTGNKCVTPREKACLLVSRRRRPCPIDRGNPLWKVAKSHDRKGQPVVERGQELNTEHAQIRTLLDRQREQILADCQAVIRRHKFQLIMTEEVYKKSETIESQQEELHRAQAEELHRRDHQFLHEQLLKQHRDLREAHEKSLNDMEELKKFQSSTFDTIARRRLVEDQDTILELIGKIQELQNEINCVNDSRDFEDAESVRSGQSHITSQPVFSHLIQFLVKCLAIPVGMPSRREGPPSIWDTHGVSGNVFANPDASSSAPYPQELHQWNSSIEEPLQLSTVEKSERQEQDQDLRCQSGPSAKSSVIFSEGDSFFNNYGADQQRLQISDLHFGKFPTPATFACWKIRFKTEVCTCSQFPTEALQWSKEVEMVDSVDELRSSSSVRGIQMQNFELLDARIASALNKIMHNFHFKRGISLEEQKAQKEDRFFFRGRQIAHLIYEYFRVTGAHDSVENYADLFTIGLRNDDIQEFDSKRDGILLSMTQIPPDDILEGLYKLRIRESEKLKTELELYNMEIHQKKAGLDYHRLKTMVKRSVWCMFFSGVCGMCFFRCVWRMFFPVCVVYVFSGVCGVCVFPGCFRCGGVCFRCVCGVFASGVCVGCLLPVCVVFVFGVCGVFAFDVCVGGVFAFGVCVGCVWSLCVWRGLARGNPHPHVGGVFLPGGGVGGGGGGVFLPGRRECGGGVFFREEEGGVVYFSGEGCFFHQGDVFFSRGMFFFPGCVFFFPGCVCVCFFPGSVFFPLRGCFFLPPRFFFLPGSVPDPRGSGQHCFLELGRQRSCSAKKYAGSTAWGRAGSCVRASAGGTARQHRLDECGWHRQEATPGRVRIAPLKLDHLILRVLPVHNDGGVSRYRAY